VTSSRPSASRRRRKWPGNPKRKSSFLLGTERTDRKLNVSIGWKLNRSPSHARSLSFRRRSQPAGRKKKKPAISPPRTCIRRLSPTHTPWRHR
jgi:hypothetical protein